MDRNRYDIAIVGGGVIGCQVAHDLAPEYDVLVVERDRVASGASGRSAGNVSPVRFYAQGTDQPAMAKTIRSFFAEFEHGPFSFEPHDRIELLETGSLDDPKGKAAEIREHGFDVEFLDKATLKARYPYFDVSRYDGALLFGDGGWLDPHTYTTALRDAATERGAEFVTGVSVKAIKTADDAVDGVVTADGDFEADHIVVAAGWRTADLLADLVKVPISPYRTQIVVLEATLPERFPIGRAIDKELYFRPEANGDLLVGGGSGPINDPDAASMDADETFRWTVAETIPELLPELDTAGFVNGWAGLDAASPDGYGIVDAPEDAPEGLIVASGFTGLGVMTAPAIPLVVRSFLGEEPPPFADFFAIDRFEDETIDAVSAFDH